MKRVFAFCLAFVICLSLAACGEKPSTEETTTQPAAGLEGNMDIVDTEYPVPPEPKALVSARFIDQLGGVHYVGEPSDYQVAIGFYAEENWKSFSFSQLSWETETYTVEKELYAGTMTQGQTFVAQVTFWGDMTTYGISVTDENDNVQHYAVYVSGKDGSLELEAYTPEVSE